MRATSHLVETLQGRSAIAGAALILCLASSQPARSAVRQPVRVYCAASEVDGFHRPGVVPSAKDLTGALRKKKRIELVGSRAEADVVVTVTGREVVEREEQRSTRRIVIAGGGGGLPHVTHRVVEKTVYATLSAGRFQIRLTANNGLFWRLAAASLAGQVEDWIDENADRLLRLRAERQAAAEAPGAGISRQAIHAPAGRGK